MQLIRAGGRSHAAIARELGIGSEMVPQRLTQTGIHAGAQHDGLSTQVSVEVRTLYRERERLLSAVDVPLGALRTCVSKEDGSHRRQWVSSWSAIRPAMPSARCAAWVLTPSTASLPLVPVSHSLGHEKTSR